MWGGGGGGARWVVVTHGLILIQIVKAVQRYNDTDACKSPYKRYKI